MSVRGCDFAIARPRQSTGTIASPAALSVATVERGGACRETQASPAMSLSPTRERRHSAVRAARGLRAARVPRALSSPHDVA